MVYVYVPAVTVFAIVTILEMAGRLSNERRSAMAIGLALAIPAIALGLYDYRLLAFVLAACSLLRWIRSLARRLAWRRHRRGRGEVGDGDDRALDDRAFDRSVWPTSGPIGRLGRVGITATWSASQLLAWLNPFQVLEICRQIAGNAALAEREERSGDDGRGYRTRAVYTLPFRGEWLLVNGGNTRTTSHSWDVLGQRFALDFVQANDAIERHTGRGTRAEQYFCYGQEILAAADGTVIRAESRVRQAFLGWGICDFTARSFVGNHVLIEHAAGEYALYAHLIRASVAVAPGDRVERGQVLGRCGHTGHSTEPHLHFHVQDSADLFGGMGLPVRFSRLFVDGEPDDGVLLTAGNRVQART